MKHTEEVKLLLNDGKLQEALEACNTLLNFAPRNTKAMVLKAKIHNIKGEFTESAELVRTLAQNKSLDVEEKSFVIQNLKAENEVQWFTELRKDGRVYHSDTRTQLAISFVGLLGCIFFLFALRTPWGNFSTNLNEILICFAGLVCLPWASLMVLHFTKIRCITLGLSGITVQKGFSLHKYSWKGIDALVLEHGNSAEEDYLKLYFYAVVSLNNFGANSNNALKKGRTPFLVLNVGENNSVVKARRHFLRNVIGCVDVVVTIPRSLYDEDGKQKESDSFSKTDSQNTSSSSKAHSNSDVA